MTHGIGKQGKILWFLIFTNRGIFIVSSMEIGHDMMVSIVKVKTSESEEGAAHYITAHRRRRKTCEWEWDWFDCVPNFTTIPLPTHAWTHAFANPLFFLIRKALFIITHAIYLFIWALREYMRRVILPIFHFLVMSSLDLTRQTFSIIHMFKLCPQFNTTQQYNFIIIRV